MSTRALKRGVVRLVLVAAVAFSGISLAPVQAAAAAAPTGAAAASADLSRLLTKVPPKRKRPSNREWRRFTRVSHVALRAPVSHRRPPARSHEKRFQRYVRRLGRALDSAHHELFGRTVTARFGWWGCAVAIAVFIGSNGFALSKVWKVASEAKVLYGSIKGIVDAFKAGTVWYDFGQDGAEILVALLGAGGLFEECF
jgi:hypothetical protein